MKKTGENWVINKRYIAGDRLIFLESEKDSKENASQKCSAADYMSHEEVTIHFLCHCSPAEDKTEVVKEGSSYHTSGRTHHLTFSALLLCENKCVHVWILDVSQFLNLCNILAYKNDSVQ